MHYMIILLLAPIVTGLLWLITARKNRQRDFIQNRLNALTAGDADFTEAPQIQRKFRLAASYTILLPKRAWDWLDVIFETTGNSVSILHLLIGAFTGSVMTSLFVSRILALSFLLVIFATALVAAVSPLVVVWMAQSRYQRRFLEIFPDALDLVRRAVKAGLPVNEALHAAGREIPDPVGMELRRAFGQVQVGIPMITALESTAIRIRIPDFQFMVVALALQEKTGGSLAETLGNLSSVIRARKALRLKARSLTAEAKVSAIILAFLPLVIGGAMSLLNSELAHMLFVDPRGYFMLGVAFLSLAIGLLTMYVIVKRALR